MRFVAPLVIAAVAGALLGHTLARAGDDDAASVGRAACVSTSGMANAKRYAEVINELLVDGRTHVLTTGESNHVVCAWR